MLQENSDFSTNIRKFVNFIDNTEIIKDFVESAGNPTFDIDAEVSEVSREYSTFDIGEDDNNEVANIYCILHHIVDCNIDYRSMIFYGYAHGSNKYQDMFDGFNSRVTMVLISHIEAFLTRKGYDMGMDQRNINNNFYGTVNNLGLQQGNNNQMINNIESTIDYYDSIKKVIDEIKQNSDAFDATFGENSTKFKEDLNELSDAVEKKDSPKIKGLLLSLKTIAEGAAGNLIASGVVALIANVM